MLKSMTAYACEEITQDAVTVGVEIRTYNSRYLDITLKVPPGHAALEDRIKSIVTSHLARGRVEIRIRITDASEQANVYAVDTSKAKAYHAALQTLKATLQLSGEVALMDLATLPGIIQPAENS